MVTFMAVAVVGWFLADAGAHGQTTDALRVGADVWLVGHGSGPQRRRRTRSAIVPLALTGLIAAGRLPLRPLGRGDLGAGRRRPHVGARRASSSPALYVVVAVVTCVVARPGLPRARASAARSSARCCSAGVAGTLGMAVGTGRLSVWVERGAGLGALGRVRRGGVVPAAARRLGGARGRDGAARAQRGRHVMSGLHLRPGDYVMYTLVTMAVAPNAVLFGSAYLLGPGFAVGTGTVVSPERGLARAGAGVPAAGRRCPTAGRRPQWAVGLLARPGGRRRWSGPVLAQRAYRVHGLRLRRAARLRLRLRRRPADHRSRSRWPAARWAPAGWPTSAPRWARCWSPPWPR